MIMIISNSDSDSSSNTFRYILNIFIIINMNNVLYIKCLN